MYAPDRFLLINFNKESHMHLFDGETEASPFKKKIFQIDRSMIKSFGWGRRHDVQATLVHNWPFKAPTTPPYQFRVQ
jgi:hypothetical protein